MRNLSTNLKVLFLSSLTFAFSYIKAQNTDAKSENWQVFEYNELEKKLKETDRPYLPFLNKPTLRTGLYVLKAGATDKQEPHKLDEVYYIISGKAKFKVENDETEVQAGSVIFVKAQASHRFFDIEEELKILVFFSEAKP